MGRHSNQTLIQVLREYDTVADLLDSRPKWYKMTEEELWQALCLCILSSNVPYESAQSALSHLTNKGYLRIRWIVKTPSSQNLIAKELSKPFYLPIKLDGSCRKYRFPNVRARNLVQAARVMFSEKLCLSDLLAGHSSESTVREILVDKIPGIGLKEASHFLRDIGYSDNLAIIDSHVASFLAEIKAISLEEVKTINRSTYFELENILQELCKEHNVSLSVFDMAVWRYMRKR
jgi:N-glycosylase/DNA lyase